MARFVFLTKTRWAEPPRIRHQIAELLADNGHDVLFFEKPTLPWTLREMEHRPRGGIVVAGQRELIHHKLRLAGPARWANSLIARKSIRAGLARVGWSDDHDAIVVNFNYDFYFLRDLFPTQRIVTVINDDFLANAPLGFTAHLRWALARTCRLSDSVLTVSSALQESLAPYARAELFLPWADQPYAEPTRDAARDVILFWGFINKKIDFQLMYRLADALLAAQSPIRILFAGPVEQHVDTQLAALARRPNVEVLGASRLDALPLHRVFASIIPYRTGAPDIDAIMLPNKALQLLARGIPLVISGMPNFIRSEFVFRLGEGEAHHAAESVRSAFDALQPAIRRFVTEHRAEARLAQFERLAGLRVHDC